MSSDRLTRMIRLALATADYRYVLTESVLHELMTLDMPGWDNSLEARVRLQDALAAARNQPEPLAAAMENIRERGELAQSRQSVFDEDSEFIDA